jgi:hypothetical protein
MGVYLLRNYHVISYVQSVLSLYFYFLFVRSLLLFRKRFEKHKSISNIHMFFVSSVLYVVSTFALKMLSNYLLTSFYFPYSIMLLRLTFTF